MKQRYIIYALFLLSLFVSISASAQIKGVITDSLTNEPLMYITVQYEGKGVGGISNANGEYQVETHKGWDELTFSAVGYITKKVKLNPGTRVLNVKLQPDDIMLSEVVVKPKKEKYSRKNNPAVEFMKKVIENKKALKLEENDYYQYQKYEKMKMSLNDVTPDKMEKGIYKKFSFFKDQVEVSPKTNKMILPISIKETASKTIFRKSPKSEKTIIEGMNSTGIEEFFNTGDMLGTILTDVFSDINIYDDDIRLLQRRFVSPIGRGAISFYKYYLMDTLMVDKQECVHLTFVPQNPQDFGFTGHLYVVKDSTYAVKKCTMNLPKKTGVNFVENLDIVQQFEQLPDSNWVLTDDDMTVELHFVKGIQGLEVQRTTKYSDYQFTEIEPRLFRLKGNVIKEANMLAKSDEYWAKVRQVPLTKKESTMDVFMNRIEQIPGFKYVIFGAKALIENFVETGGKKHPSKFDFGPINTMITSNYVNGTRFRLSGMTTGNLDPHWSLSGYGAYGTKDKKWFYSGQVAYSFNKREYVLWEFPKHYIAFKYTYDVMSPMDKYLATDKDNLFVGWKWTTVDQMSYMRDATLTYELETNTGFSVQAMARHRNDQPAGQLQYWKNNGGTPGQWDEKNTLVHDITTTELGVTLRYAPGETFVNTKQRRVPVSLDAPTFTLSHTAGFKSDFGSLFVGAIIFHIKLKIKEFIDKLVFFHQSVTAFTGCHFIKCPYFVSLDTRMPDEEWNRFGRMRTELAGSGMVGQYGDGNGFLPILHSLVDRTYSTAVQILNRHNLQGDVSFMTGLITGFDMQVDKIIRPQCIESGSHLILIVGIIKPRRTFYGDTPQPRIVADAVNQIHGRNHGAAPHLRKLV